MSRKNPVVAAWFEKNIDDLPMLKEVDWELACRVEEVLRPLALTSAPLRCEAKDSSGTYERPTVDELRAAAIERDEDPHTLRLFVNGPEGDGQTPRFLNVQQSANPQYGSTARFIAADRAAVAVLADRIPTLFASSKMAIPPQSHATVMQVPGALAESERSWWQPDPHDIVNQVIAGLLIAALIALFVFLWHRGTFSSGSSQTGARTVTAELLPEVLMGNGTETLNANGSYAGQQFIARQALVLDYGRGFVSIVFYPQPITCATWFLGTPEGLDFEIHVNVRPQTINVLPIGKPLQEYSLWWNREKANSFHLDMPRKPGSVTLTLVDTHRGGFWRGQVTSTRGRTAEGKLQEFHGTFAAEWCGYVNQ